ncbi:MAG: hypothetical protein WCL70_14220 [Paludibacter sp.]
MSLDVSLYSKTTISKKGTGVFIRENGNNRELTISEIQEKYPNAEIEVLEYETDCVFQANITHNLGKMATEAGIYYACWRPEEIDAKVAKDIIPLLEKGFEDMKSKPDYYKQFDSSNGWGIYVDFLPWVEEYLKACKAYPEAEISVSR